MATPPSRDHRRRGWHDAETAAVSPESAPSTSGPPSASITQQLGVLWGKSDAAGRPHLLLAHLLDTAAVAEHIWEEWLAPVLRERLDECSYGRGRALLAWLCGVHDVGKATPAFQAQDPHLAAAVTAAGLPLPRLPRDAARRWRHDRAGGKILRDAALDAGWSRVNAAWVWPLIAGHHGAFPGRSMLTSPAALGSLHGGDATWSAVQRTLLDAVTAATGFGDLADAEPTDLPSRAHQLALSGVIVMADWIASDARHFPGLDTLIDMETARTRATQAWRTLGLRGGWDPGRLIANGDVVGQRFAATPRPLQTMVVDAAGAMPAPGLRVVEAPTGGDLDAVSGRSRPAAGSATGRWPLPLGSPQAPGL